jgi:hypothetical protein
LICSIVLAMLSLLSAPFVISSIIGHRDRISQRVKRWQTKHNLSDSQAEEILAIELKFHGSGNPLSFRRARSDREKEAHRREIENLLGHDDPTRFQEARPE